MRELSVSTGVIRQGREFVLQRRRDDPRIGAAGLIGAFGGKIERNETAEHAVVRELSEETTLVESDMDVSHVASYDVVADINHEAVVCHIEAFMIKLKKDLTVQALDGSIVRLRNEEIDEHLTTMTPATRYYFENYMEA